MKCIIILLDNLIFYILGREEIKYLSNASITLVREFGIPYKRKLTFLFPLINLKQHQNFFSRNIYLNLTTPANSLHPSHILFISF